MFHFTIRELVLVTLVAAMGAAWWMDGSVTFRPIRDSATPSQSAASQTEWTVVRATIRGRHELLKSRRFIHHRRWVTSVLMPSFERGPTMNCQVACSSILAAALLFEFSPDHFALAEALDEGTDKVFVGYVYRRPEKINFGLYTHLCHAFVVADEDGTIRPNRSCPSRELVADAHKAGVRVLISLGGWGWDKQFAAIVSKPEAEDRYVKSVVAIVDEYNYDGIDLDWEYPDTREEVVGFERLSRRFRKQLDELGQKKGRHLFRRWLLPPIPPRLNGSPTNCYWRRWIGST